MDLNNYIRYIHTDEKFVEFWENYFNNHNWSSPDEKVGIYIDFPFCRSICDYCIFSALNFYKNKENVIKYENAMVNLIGKMSNVLSKRIPNDIYFGGGTASLWSMNAIRNIIKNIPNYYQIPVRKSEAHPYDLTQERIDFMIHEMKINSISIGVQSFDKTSNLNQKRIPVDINKINEIVKKFQENNVYVGLDIVALFNGDSEHNWELFRQDMISTFDVIKPDVICTSPNFKSKRYYEDAYIFRDMIKSIIPRYPEYHINENILSLDKNDIIEFGDGTYFFITDKYHDFITNNKSSELIRSLDVVKNNNIIGFGGDHKHKSISRTAELDQLLSYFDFGKNRWKHSLEKINFDSRKTFIDN